MKLEELVKEIAKVRKQTEKTSFLKDKLFNKIQKFFVSWMCLMLVLM
ncbi:hypothetical protein K413DRAFT_4298 [Clostridium sp. ASBs410]|jgi:hypothetical protein|nr:hypothetical protein K413DRAFT_4298 [Clostridium sp. ASBs410]